MPDNCAEPGTDEPLRRHESCRPPLAWRVLTSRQLRLICLLTVLIASLIPRFSAIAHECAIVVSRDDAKPPRLHVNGPSNYLSGDETIDLLPGDGTFEGMWLIDAPGLSTMLKDGSVRKRFRLRAGHRIALRLVSADPGYCMVEPSTWKPVLCKPGDTYPFVLPENGDFNIQMASRLAKPQPCRATFQFVDLAGLHADSAPFSLRFRVDPFIAIGRSFAPAITSARKPGLQMAAYWMLPAAMGIGASGSAAGGQVRAADGHLHGAPPVWVEPVSFKQGVNLFRGHLHDLDSELLAGKFSAAALRAPVLQRLAAAMPALIKKADSPVPPTSRNALLDASTRSTATCEALLVSARLSDSIAVREQHSELAKFLTSCDAYIPPEYICPMRCEGEKLYATERDCPTCGMALADSRAHMDHKPKHGGTFFMAADNKHHLEGVLVTEGLPKDQREFRVYIYDEFTQPLAADVVRARAVFSTPASDETHQAALMPDKDRKFLASPVPPSLNPVSIKLYVDFKNARGEQLFDFRF